MVYKLQKKFFTLKSLVIHFIKLYNYFPSNLTSLGQAFVSSSVKCKSTELSYNLRISSPSGCSFYFWSPCLFIHRAQLWFTSGSFLPRRWNQLWINNRMLNLLLLFSSPSPPHFSIISWFNLEKPWPWVLCLCLRTFLSYLSC